MNDQRYQHLMEYYDYGLIKLNYLLDIELKNK